MQARLHSMARAADYAGRRPNTDMHVCTTVNGSEALAPGRCNPFVERERECMTWIKSPQLC